MPLYDYKCESCGAVAERYAKMDALTLECRKCGGPAKRQLTRAFYAHGDLEPYVDPHLADKPVFVKSREHRRKLMREHGVQEIYGKGWK